MLHFASEFRGWKFRLIPYSLNYFESRRHTGRVLKRRWASEILAVVTPFWHLAAIDESLIEGP